MLLGLGSLDLTALGSVGVQQAVSEARAVTGGWRKGLGIRIGLQREEAGRRGRR